MPTALDAQVRRVDEDRWLASRFAPADVRAKLIALYALNDEIARTAEVVSTPLLADIRLAWWREAIAEIYAGAPARAHPTLSAFAAARAAWPKQAFDPLIDAWGRDVERGAFETWPALETHLDATAGQLMHLALAACGADANAAFVTPAARAWGYLIWARAGRAAPAGEPHTALLARAEAAHAEARKHAKDAPASAFPAIGYVALIPGYIRSLRAGQRERPLFLRQLRLVAAAATGAL